MAFKAMQDQTNPVFGQVVPLRVGNSSTYLSHFQSVIAKSIWEQDNLQFKSNLVAHRRADSFIKNIRTSEIR